MSAADFSTVTETPDAGATAEQLSAIYTRYRFAAEHVEGKDVLEVACGVGNGLGYLARRARRVVGGDIDESNLSFARDTYRGSDRVEIRHLDAQGLPFEDDSFDVVILFEALYYIPQPERFLREAHRVLRPGGKLLISAVHPDWPGFNPSPFSVRYFNAEELATVLGDEGFTARIFAGFGTGPRSFLRKMVNELRKIAVRLKLIPRTMRGKQFLKRLFYGRLTPLPRIVEDGMAPAEDLVAVDLSRPVSNFKFLYVVAENQRKAA